MSSQSSKTKTQRTPAENQRYLAASLRNKASRAARAKRRHDKRVLQGVCLPHRENNTPAAKARQLRRKERNTRKPTVEKVFEHNKDTHITSFALIVTQPEE